MTRRLVPLAMVFFLITAARTASAQMGGGLPGAGGGRGGQDDKPDKPKVAEQGKEPEKVQEPERVRSWGLKKPIQFFQLDGYFRVRSDVFYKLHLGIQDSTAYKPPFLRPLQYYDKTGTGAFCTDSNSKLCKKSAITSTNMRLHLEPTFNIHSRARVRMTVDMFDNFVLGSTPEGYNTLNPGGRAPYSSLNAFASTAEVPQAGRNSLYDAIMVKHAWGEVDLPFGRLSFGRMPSHWGMGMLANSGLCSSYQGWTVHHKGDPERCMDSDYGDIADRVMFATKIPIVDLLVGFSWDFQASGLTTLNLQGQQRILSAGQPYDLTPEDDVQQWVALLGRIDNPLVVKERLARGEVVFNYGTYWVFRKQKLDYSDTSTLLGNEGALAGQLVRRNAFAMIPDLWLRLNWQKLQLEFEGVFIYGWIGDMEDVAARMAKEGKDYRIRQWGWTFRGSYRLLKDSLYIGVEMGMASGDDELEDRSFHQTNYRNILLFPENAGDRWQTLFRFDPNYRVDLIFFRELMGTVYNAGYVKPTVQYHILKDLTARMDMIYAFAVEPVATPGNSPHYGIELDFDVEYRWPEAGFYVGIAYGVFFPLDALHRPASIYGDSFDAKAKIAQSVQLRAQLKF
ncbi:MAG: TIGR04551 family protein [Polyangia bacterium]|jgi:uncharacterized protein (TIGR04551 family)|nr:TIGR04551 family protein [Polyangia bacterium]